uniref:DNA-directed DNA polymerase n=1 Tax=Globodera rostochiensis TaxID=31243 RepID=A0A914I0R6_GLORO
MVYPTVAMIVEEGVKIEDIPEYKEWQRRQGLPRSTPTSPKTTTPPVTKISTGIQPCKDRPANDNFLGHIYCWALFALYAMMMFSLIIYQLRSILWIKQRGHPQNSSHSSSPSKRNSPLHHLHLYCSGMDSNQISQILEANPLTRRVFHGCFPCDRLPNPQTLQPKTPTALIVNLDPEGMKGSHWIAIFVNGSRERFVDGPSTHFFFSYPYSYLIHCNSSSPNGRSAFRKACPSWLCHRRTAQRPALFCTASNISRLVAVDRQRRTPEDYVRKLDEDVEHSAKFKRGQAPLDSDVWTPIREINDNTVDVILNRFLSVVQSKQQNNVSLLGGPFTVTVTTVSRQELPAVRTLKGSARRPNQTVQHQISEHALIKIRNQNNHCLFLALIATLMHNISKWAPWKFFDYINGRYGSAGQFEQDTEKLMRCVGAPLFQNGYEASVWVPRVVDYWNNECYVNEHSIKVYIFGESGRYKPLFKYGPDSYTAILRLYFNNNHFDGVKTSGRLFGKPYCLSCEVPYDKAANHTKSCKARCMLCGRVGPAYPCIAEEGFKQFCSSCNKTFTSINCLQHHHLHSNFCARSKKCLECGVIWDVKANTTQGRAGHKCNERFCNTCLGYHSKDRGCFIQPLEPKHGKPYRIVSFDLETMQHVVANPEAAAEKQKKIHQANFIAAKVACPKCIYNGCWRSSLTDTPCVVCGPCRTITFNHQPFNDTKVDKADLFRRGLCPQMIRKGNKMYEMKVNRQQGSNPNVIFRDSYNLMPCSLAALVPAYGLDVVEKPFFPHLVNRPENYGTLVWPTKDDYMANGMMPAKRSDFDKWYSQNKQHPFRLEEALASYCVNDVEILMCALVAFRTEFMEVSKRGSGSMERAAFKSSHNGIDVLREAMTIAAACMRHFKINHLRARHLAIVPEKGYDNADNQSMLALKYLQWYSEKHGVKVQGAHSPEMEKKIANYKVDGWVETLGRAIEVNGCVWHGCSRCYPLDEQLLPNGKTAGMTRQLDASRLAFIRSQVKEVEVVWECDIRKQLEKDGKMRSKFERYRDEGPLSIRECFTGGRCGPRKMFHGVQPGQKISYYDVTSLYPFINATTKYPVGHPKVHVLNADVSWTLPEHNPYQLALLKVFVIPPRTIDIPVLPLKADDRLIFGVCHSCACEYPNGGVLRDYSCKHDDEERGWVSSCTSIELNAALEEGYHVTKLYRVLEYTQSDDTLFQPYIAEFMAQKLHASGFSDEIKGCEKAEQQYVSECAERFGIHIDQQKMVPNKGKRSLAKLALNNLWGRFSMRNELTQTFVTSDPVALTEHLDDRSKEVTALDVLSDSTMMISFTTKKEWLEEHGCSNIVVSLWTTSAARLYLLKLMQKIVRSGADLLYTDTDSVIFCHNEAANPLTLGPHLGDLTDEYPQHEILEFCCGGAKQYGLKLRRKDNGEIEHVLKLRGITLNYDVKINQNLCYTTFRERVLLYSETGKLDPIPVFTNSLKPNIKKGEVTSEKTSKVYKPYVGKGIVGTDHGIRDFGYIRPK